MSRTIEVDFLPQAFEEAKEKPRILIIDNNRDFTYSAKLGLERTGATPFGKRTNQPGLTKQRNALTPTLFFLILRCRKRMAAKSPRGLNPIQHCTEHRLSF
jgi:hypothetical protein